MIKLYEDGLVFLEENKEILNRNRIASSFIRYNAKAISSFSKSHYIVKSYQNDQCLFGLYLFPFHLCLFGDESQISELALYLIKQNLTFNSVLSDPTLGEQFLKEYSKITQGTFKVNLSMQAMVCTTRINQLNGEIRMALESDKGELIESAICMSEEAIHKKISHEEAQKIVNKNLREKNYYVYVVENKVASFVKLSRKEEDIVCLSFVYTKKDYRGNHYSHNLVGTITNQILDNGKTPYLFVDKENKISNHLYQSLGYTYEDDLTEFSYQEGSIKHAIFAGGCFWCMSKPYYEYDGVKAVYSGYTGGIEILPTYKIVKQGNTGYKEAIMVLYDEKIISYETLLKIYFETIDPFDENGQFIDRGSNYTCAIYTHDDKFKDKIHHVICEIERESGKKTYVPVLDEGVFFLAEEYHQDFAIKNKDLMEQELITSGRKK